MWVGTRIRSRGCSGVDLWLQQCMSSFPDWNLSPGAREHQCWFLVSELQQAFETFCPKGGWCGSCVCVYGDSSAFGLEILIWLKIKALLASYFSAFLGLVEDNE